MAYTDNKGMSAGKLWSIIIVIAIHALLAYAFITGLAYSVAKKVADELNVINVEEPPPPPEKLPPPPPKTELPPPPVVSPPAIVQTRVETPTITTVATPPPVYTPTPEPPRPAPPPAPPPPKPVIASRATQRGGSITNDDYPPSAIRNGEAGTSVASFVVGTDGKVQSCTASGASAALDAETCKLIIRRFRYKAATDASGQPVAESKTQRITWRLPSE